ncbi:LysR substrate-binding domain-containing protein [Tatumella citrea]|uniref:Transcriptional regulator n=1 Tax=Tatumella citrea TaxID=53336 RepID=A0A1Y0L9L5_TATCI|nr:LysR substrate-binding domain-containing protein [Tatumella citrea]ARU94339.1 transcriptional regulator [Tatumella citrea]ARU98379.1 transcriptional regulator [Tatumella citrea]
MSAFPPIAGLRSFEAVARLGSVTRAATELHVTHSAISQQIKTLEQLTGVKLFIRHGRGLRLSEQGRLYALQIRQALNQINDATRLVQVLPRREELTIAGIPSFISHWLVPRLSGFRRQYPEITLRLVAGLEIGDLQQGTIDLAIRMGKGDWPAVSCRKMFSDQLLVVASPDFNDGQLPVTAEQIAASNIIFSMESWQSWSESAGLQSPVVPQGLCINDSNLVLEAVRCGQGIALERRSLVQELIRRGELVQLGDCVVAYPWDYWRVIPLSVAEKPALGLFCQWLDEQVEQWEAEFGIKAGVAEHHEVKSEDSATE